MNRRVFAASAAFAAGAAALGIAGAQEQTQRIKGTIASIDGSVLSVDTGTGTVKVALADKLRVSLEEPATLGSIGAGDFIGSGAVPQPDGTQRAVEVHIFAESMRGTGEGFRPWGGAPNGTMTNATVQDIASASVAGVDGRLLTLKYNGGEQRLFVPPSTPIVRLSPGDRAALVPGAHVSINAAKAPDGTLSASFLNVGKNGFVPPV